MTAMSNSGARRSLLIAFTLSGFSGLIYESLWTHYLKLFLGHAAYAQTLVLAIFMGGLAVGSWTASRRSRVWVNLLRAYALAEFGIGLVALLFHPVFIAITDLAFTQVLPALNSPGAVTLFKWILGSAMILPQSIVLGMTFPLMAGGFMRIHRERPGASIALLYFCNSIGGAVGVLVSGFYLVPHLGLAGTGIVAGVINLALASVVWRVATGTQQSGAPEESAEDASAARPEADAPFLVLVAVSLLTGTASFIYEIGWTRMLSLVLGSSTQAFELMLSAFILGLALGGLWIRRQIDTLANPFRFLGFVQIGMGALALATLALYTSMFLVMRWLIATLPKTDLGYLTFNFASHAIAMVIMLPATFLAGSTLPLITLILVRSRRGESSIGSVYGANTVGAIAGVLFAVHVGLPMLGLKYVIAAGAGLDMALGLMLLWRDRARSSRGLALPAAVAVVAMAVILAAVQFDTRLMVSGVFRTNQQALSDAAAIVFHRDGKTATVAVTDDGINVAIRTNGKIDASVNVAESAPPSLDEPTQVLSGALPLLLHPSARRAINVGLGSGMTSHVLLSAPSLEAVDTVEIERAMVEGAERFLPRNTRTYTDPRSNIIIDDAKTYLSTYDRRYDIIISEPSNPWVSGTASLFSNEFYRVARRHLAPDGVFVQWLQLYEFDIDLVASVLKALGQHFDDYAIYVPARGDILIVAVVGRSVPEPSTGIDANPEFKALLRRVNIRTPQDLATRKIADKRLLQPWLATVAIPANSDYRPTLDHRANRARFLDTDAQSLEQLAFGPLPFGAFLSGKKSQWQSTDLTYVGSSPLYLHLTAMQVRDRLMKRAAPVDRPGAWPGGVTPAQLADNLLSNCQKAATYADRRLASFRAGWPLAAFLQPLELEAVWPQFESLPCVSQMDQAGTNLVRLFKAVGRREPREMALATEPLLAAEPAGSELRSYAFGAALIGRYTSGDVRGARELLTQGESSAGRWGFLFRVIAAHVAGSGA
jgi:spermidine synthase